MLVKFENRNGILRDIATVSTMEEAHKEIEKFCKERNFEIKYTRGWEEEDGTVVIDVGSHSEFFHIV